MYCLLTGCILSNKVKTLDKGLKLGYNINEVGIEPTIIESIGGNGMVKVTVSVEGEEREIRSVLQGLFVGGTASTVSVMSPAEAEDVKSDEATWTGKEIEELWSEITTTAQRIMSEIARSPAAKASFKQVQGNLDMKPLELAGTLSSLGFAFRRRPGKPRFYETDYGKREYRMRPEVARIIREMEIGGNADEK